MRSRIQRAIWIALPLELEAIADESNVPTRAWWMAVASYMVEPGAEPGFREPASTNRAMETTVATLTMIIQRFSRAFLSLLCFVPVSSMPPVYYAFKRDEMALLNCSPRSYSFLNFSKLLHPGENNIVALLNRRAFLRASATHASSVEYACTREAYSPSAVSILPVALPSSRIILSCTM